MLPCVTALVLGGATFPALADTPNCADIAGGAPIVYGSGGSSQRDLIGKAAVELENSDHPIYVVYQDSGGACAGINALTALGPTAITGTAYYWPADTGTKTSCNLSFSGDDVQFAVMGVSPLLCPLITDASLVEGIHDLSGPISAYVPIVPLASTQQSISAAAFYLVYGLGPAAGIAPWTNPDASYLQRRDENSAAQIIFSAATGLPVNKYQGTDAGSNTTMVANLTALPDPEAGLGFVSTDVADVNRDKVRTLAWRQTGQEVARWPDSSSTTFDKANVRDGAYHLWNPIHFFGLAGAGGPDSWDNPEVQALVEYLAGASTPAGVEKSIDSIAIANHNIPVCAMHVAREGDLGPEYAAPPEAPCDCLFDQATSGITTCDTCDDANPCAAGTCRAGFCEAY